MITLFIDTADKYLSIYLFKNNEILSFFREKNDLNLSSKLVPTIAKVIEKGSIQKNEVNQIMVVTGPGSFTGIRMGVTVAKTYAYALGIKVIPVSKLEVLSSFDKSDELILSLIDARANYVYGGLYDSNLNCLMNDAYLSTEELLDKIKPYKNVKISSYDDINIDIKVVLPEENIIKIVEKHLNDEGVNPHKLNPNYLKRTEAEEKNDKN